MSAALQHTERVHRIPREMAAARRGQLVDLVLRLHDAHVRRLRQLYVEERAAEEPAVAATVDHLAVDEGDVGGDGAYDGVGDAGEGVLDDRVVVGIDAEDGRGRRVLREEAGGQRGERLAR